MTEKGLEGVDLLDKKILALLTEFGELANEWRGFKFWSEDQEPITHIEKWKTVDGHNYYAAHRNPLLEEYVDCLHFILSIGLDLDLQDLKGASPENANNFKNINRGFNCVFDDVAILNSTIEAECDGYLGVDDLRESYHLLVNDFVRLGEKLGLTWGQIEQAYYDKNKINHERQENGY
jgi:dimeric dUTPase (all-alpha-NTP-PPase superfamily)